MAFLPAPFTWFVDPDRGYVAGDDAQKAAIVDALTRCPYPWERLRWSLQARGENDIGIYFHDHVRSQYGASGLAWRHGAIGLIPGYDPDRTARVLLYEAAHMVDFFLLMDRHRALLDDHFHDHAGTDDPHAGADGWFDRDVPYGAQAGEAFMYAFTAAFGPSDLAPTSGARWTHGMGDPDRTKEIVLMAQAQGPSFDDVDEGHIHYDGIDLMARLGIVNGRPDGTFGPGEPVTRGQVVTMLAGLYQELQPEQVPLGHEHGGHAH
jgi:hypothetical protein